MRKIYADFASSSPCAPEVVEAMLPYFSGEFANPSARTHGEGLSASAAVETARARVANLIGARPHEIIFTASATESNNIAILGLQEALRKSSLDIALTKMEHKSVSAPAKATARVAGVSVRTIAVSTDGLVDLRLLSELLSSHQIGLLSVQFSSNEIGTIQPLKQIAEIAHSVGAVVHSDASNGLVTEVFDVRATEIDLATLSAHKMYGPKGVSALFIKGGAKSSPLLPILYGGEQEWGLRPGTMNVPMVVGMGVACDLVSQRRDAEGIRLKELRRVFEKSLQSGICSIHINGSDTERSGGISSITFADVEAEAILARLGDASISFGAACESGAITPSDSLLAIGKSRQEAFRTIRVSFGASTSTEDALRLAHLLTRIHDEVAELM